MGSRLAVNCCSKHGELCRSNSIALGLWVFQVSGSHDATSLAAFCQIKVIHNPVGIARAECVAASSDFINLHVRHCIHVANTFTGINRYAFIATGQSHFRYLAKYFLVGQPTICLQYLEFMMVNDKISRELQQFANLISGKRITKFFFEKLLEFLIIIHHYLDRRIY